MNPQRMKHWCVVAGVLLMALYMSAHAVPPEDAKPEDAIREVRKLNEQALELYNQGRYQEATPLAQRAAQVSEQELGIQHPETASSLDILGRLYRAMGAYARAEPLYHRALAMREKALGPEHPETADSLNHLANLYFKTGAYAKAKSLHERALAIRQKVLGAEHPTTAGTLKNLALLHAATGAYAEAEQLYQRVLAIRKKAQGPEHPDTADALNSLANLYSKTGAYAKAESLYQQVLVIQEKAFGPEHLKTGNVLGNLANLYYRTGAYAKAEPLYQRVLVIQEKALGSKHPETAASLYNLALLYSATGAYARAEPLAQRALAIREKVVGAEHHETADSLNNLASLYFATGAYAQAEPMYQRALSIFKKALGPEHPDVAFALTDLANFYSATGAYAKAEPLYQRAQVIQTKNSERFLPTGSESRKLAYLQDVAKSAHRNVSFSVSAPSRGSVALGFTAVLQYKGRVLDEVSDSVARLRQSVKPADHELFEQLAAVANQFSTLTYQGLGDFSPEQYRQRLDQLSQQQEVLEAELARRSVEFRLQVTPVTLSAVSRAIPAGAVLIEWFRYRPFDPKVTRPKDQRGSPRYVAYVLKAGGEPSLVDIGDAQVIETSVHDFLKAVQDPTSSDIKQRARDLSDKIVRPLLGYLNAAERVLISPDGILNLVPMAALLDENGQYLVQRFEMTYLTSGRDVLRIAAASGSQSGAIVIADPDYGNPTSSSAPTEPLAQAQRSADLDRSGIVFRSLANTASEAQVIKALLKLDDASVMMRLDATESNLKQLHGPRILHVASHGFFLNDQDLAAQFGPWAEKAMHTGENPLLRAGIALAGANTRRSGASDDGILTALEAAQLDLHGTELVVLSACESGVGQVQNGEGVYGLRRALFIAGAQTQIASLWKVADRATGTLMVDYYRRLLEGRGRSAALREAQQKMLAIPRRSHPYYWSGFIPIGDWTPLTAKRD